MVVLGVLQFFIHVHGCSKVSNIFIHSKTTKCFHFRCQILQRDPVSRTPLGVLTRHYEPVSTLYAQLLSYTVLRFNLILRFVEQQYGIVYVPTNSWNGMLTLEKAYIMWLLVIYLQWISSHVHCLMPTVLKASSGGSLDSAIKRAHNHLPLIYSTWFFGWRSVELQVLKLAQ